MALLLLGSCTKQVSPSDASALRAPAASRGGKQTESAPASRLVAHQVELTKQDEKGRLVWRLKAEQAVAQVAKEEGSGELRNVQGILYQRGKPALHIQAHYARADKRTERIVAWQQVQARSQVNQAELQADKIVWEWEKDLLTVEGNVRLRWQKLELTDQQLQADTALKRVWGRSIK